MNELVLVVEDDESVREMCEVFLGVAGYQVSSCESGEAAIKLLERQPFDLVLTDIQLPGSVGGRAVLAATKAVRPEAEVVIMTAAPSVTVAVEVLKEGASDFIIKPFNPDHLGNVLRRCLDQARLRKELAGESALRRELQAAYQELQKVEELKEAFLSRVSHELRTPVAELGMAVQLLEEGASKPDFAEHRERWLKYVGMANAGYLRLEKTVADLVAFVDVQKKTEVGETSPVDLGAICQDTMERLKPIWEPRRLSVSVEFEPGAGTVEGDPALLAKAFEHLIHNAIVFNREGGKVQVHGRALQGRLEVSVSDTGEGIPESEFDRVFDSFYQIANYLTRRVEGLGLGLALTRRIIEAHGGEILVASRVGEGSSFTVILPFRRKAS